MLFSSIFFLFVFLPSVLIIYYYLLKQRKSRNIFLLIVSLIFYGWGEPKYLLLILLSIGINFAGGRIIQFFDKERLKAKITLSIIIIFNLSLLGIFKYTYFIVENLNKLKMVGLSLPEAVLPLGISFFTFQGISYVIDVYRKKAKALSSPLDVGLYVALFPQLVAGPIVRYETIAKEIYDRKETEALFFEGIDRFIKGLGKKVLLANNFALIADKAFGMEVEAISVGLAWMGAAAYMLQIYFDFSGYSDMAIGLGKMFGFHLPENFKAPYLSKSISEFWRRWHISLGTWFRDYVYFPLGGSQVKSIKIIRNLFIVWLLTGIWHGANWTFILWGIYFFCWILLEKLFGLKEYFNHKKIIGHCYVLSVVLFGWVLFRAESVTYAVNYIKAMFALNSNTLIGDLAVLYWSENKILFVLGIMACLPFKKYLIFKKEELFPTRVYIRSLVWFMIYITAVAYLVKGTYNPFIYFNF